MAATMRVASTDVSDRDRDMDIVGCRNESGTSEVASATAGRNADHVASIAVATRSLFQRIIRPYLKNGFPLGRLQQLPWYSCE